MQLHHLGPDFPEALIDDLLEGDVVFLCGAGVSAPQLPDFRVLVERVYARLGEYREDAEELAFLEGRYEETLGALARRLARSDEVIEAAAAELQIADGANTSQHETIIRLSRDRDGRPAIVTTNFDTLFERALAGKLRQDQRVQSFSSAGQDIPAPGSARFEGIIHIHGRLSDPSLNLSPTELVLTSAQYGEAYLRSGWAARFLFDLARCRTLVLVGYTASDAPVRYILNVLEGDRERFTDLRQVYALSLSEENPAISAARWKALAVKPLLFSATPENSYAALWSSLSALADLIERPDDWRRATIARVIGTRLTDAPQSDVDDLKWAIRGRGDLLDIVADHCVDAGWFGVLNAEITSVGANALAWTIRRWLSREWTSRERWEFAVGLIDRPVAGLSDLLWYALEANAPPTELWEKAWRLLTRVLSEPRHNDSNDYGMLARFKSGFVSEADLRQLVNATAPRLLVSASSSRERSDVPDLESLALIGRFHMEKRSDRGILTRVQEAAVSDTKNIVRLFKLACERLRSQLELARDSEIIHKAYDPTDWSVPSVIRHGQNAHRGGFVPIVELVTQLMPLIVDIDPNVLLHAAEGWRTESFNLFKRLWLHSLTFEAVASADHAMESLLTAADEVFWSFDREFAAVIRSRAADASPDLVERLVTRVLTQGPLRGEGAPQTDEDVDWKGRARDRDMWLRLASLTEVLLIPATAPAAVALDAIRSRRKYLARNVEERDQFNGWSSGVRHVRGNPTRLISAAPNDRLAIADELEQSHDLDDREGWSEYCRQDINGSLEALMERSLELSLAPRWKTWFRLLPYNPDMMDETKREAALRAIDFVDAGDASFFASLVNELSELLERSEVLGLVIPSGWFDRLWVAAEEEPRPEMPEEYDLYDQVINSAGGALCEFLLQRLNKGYKPGHAIDPVDLERLRAMLTSDTFAGEMVRGSCARNLSFVHPAAPDVIEQVLRPYLVGIEPESARLRAVMLEYNGFPPATEIAFSASILKGVAESRSRGNVSAANVASHLIRAVVEGLQVPETPRGISAQQTKDALREASPEVRVGALTILVEWLGEVDVADRSDAWRNCFGPAFGMIWPKDRRFVSSETSMEIFKLAIAAEDAFEEALQTLGPYIRPLAGDWLHLHEMKQNDEYRIVDKYPDAALNLLWAVCKPPCVGRSSDIAEILDRISGASPAATIDRRLQRLRLRSDRF